MTGTIKKILNDKGFGFIELDDGSDDIIFNAGAASHEFSSRISLKLTACGSRRAGDKGPVAYGIKPR